MISHEESVHDAAADLLSEVTAMEKDTAAYAVAAPPAASGTRWFTGFCFQTDRAWRSRGGRRPKKEFTSDLFAREPATDTSIMIARWPDGAELPIDVLTKKIYSSRESKPPKPARKIAANGLNVELPSGGVIAVREKNDGHDADGNKRKLLAMYLREGGEQSQICQVRWESNGITVENAVALFRSLAEKLLKGRSRKMTCTASVTKSFLRSSGLSGLRGGGRKSVQKTLHVWR